jgi:hypothetical protein
MKGSSGTEANREVKDTFRSQEISVPDLSLPLSAQINKSWLQNSHWQRKKIRLNDLSDFV